MREGLVLMIQSDSFEQAVFNAKAKPRPRAGFEKALASPTQNPTLPQPGKYSSPALSVPYA
jgi:hypothetical protein